MGSFERYQVAQVSLAYRKIFITEVMPFVKLWRQEHVYELNEFLCFCSMFLRLSVGAFLWNFIVCIPIRNTGVCGISKFSRRTTFRKKKK